ncbi:MAG: AMP-binding protein, partial [Deltaproteobacteria bacterium]|nr:AMP-binding protein [Deltaproteobacteria bacterium]
VTPRFEPNEYLENIVKYKATSIGGAPQLFVPLLNRPDFDSYDFSSLKTLFSGAAPLAMPILKRMMSAFASPVIEAYGLTEATLCVSCNPYSSEKIKQGSVGLPVFDTEIKIVGPDSGEKLPPGSEGELCVKGPQVMKGYWNKSEETAKIIKDGWLHTGDIAYVDTDGYIFITDRLKDMIIYKGYNVYPSELESVIFEHPAVAQCAVVGKPDIDVGEQPVAFVELKKDVKATKDDIMEHTNTKIAAYKKIRNIIFTDQIPISAAGKILKRELRENIIDS